MIIYGGGNIKNILIVEDDIALSKGISLALKNEKFNIFQASSIMTAKNYINKTKFNLFILDVNLPDGNGIDFMKELKEEDSVPVIILTANDMETDIVTGLESGADDYITKPFSLAVLRARVNTQLRKQTEFNDKTTIDNFEFDFDKMQYKKNKIEIDLSKTEQKLLKILVYNKGNTVSRTHLVDKIWTGGEEYVDENALSVTIKRLRNKLEDNPSKPKYIKTIYGIGYTWSVI